MTEGASRVRSGASVIAIILVDEFHELRIRETSETSFDVQDQFRSGALKIFEQVCSGLVPELFTGDRHHRFSIGKAAIDKIRREVSRSGPAPCSPVHIVRVAPDVQWLAGRNLASHELRHDFGFVLAPCPPPVRTPMGASSGEGFVSEHRRAVMRPDQPYKKEHT